MRKRLGQDNTPLGFSCYINPIINKYIKINDTVTALGDHLGEMAILLIKNHNSNTI